MSDISLPFSRWGLASDAFRIIAARAVRTFGYGCTSVLLSDMITADGLSGWYLGILLAVAAAGCVTASVVMGLFADQWGRRRCLLVTAVLMALAGITFACSESYPMLLAAAFIGTISPSTNDNSPFSGVEQTILAQTSPSERHTLVFTVYSVTAQLAGGLGGLAAALLGLQSWVEPGNAAFALYAILALLTAILFLNLSPHAERSDMSSVEQVRTARRMGGPIPRLAALFGLDAFAGGLVVQAVLALWLHQRFGASVVQLGLVFFAANIVPALTQVLAPVLAKRIGLLTTMLVPHACANLLLLAVPLASSLPVAIALFLARQALSKIDVPARQAFTAAVVTPQERTVAASLTAVARSIAVSVSPLACGLLLTGPLITIGAPLILGGALGMGYDLTMWRTFGRSSGQSQPEQVGQTAAV